MRFLEAKFLCSYGGGAGRGEGRHKLRSGRPRPGWVLACRDAVAKAQGLPGRAFGGERLDGLAHEWLLRLGLFLQLCAKAWK